MENGFQGIAGSYYYSAYHSLVEKRMSPDYRLGFRYLENPVKRRARDALLIIPPALAQNPLDYYCVAVI